MLLNLNLLEKVVSVIASSGMKVCFAVEGHFPIRQTQVYSPTKEVSTQKRLRGLNVELGS